jgi:hypothetical protein
MLPGFRAPIGYRDVRSSAVTTKSCVAHRNSHPCTGDSARSRGASCRSGPQQTVADGSPILALTAPESGRTPRAAAEVVRAPHRWHTAKAIRDAGASPSPRAGPSHVCVRGCSGSRSRCRGAQRPRLGFLPVRVENTGSGAGGRVFGTQRPAEHLDRSR